MKHKNLLIAMLVALMSAGLVFGGLKAGASSYDDQIAAAQKKQEQLEKLLEQAEARKAEFEQKQKDSEAYLAELSGDIDKVSAYIQEVDEQLQGIYDRLSDLNFQISEKEEELVQTKLDLADAIERQQEQYETMKKRIRYTYENGSESLLEILVGSHSIADFLNRVEYRMSIAEYDNTLYERYQAATKLVIATKEYLEASIADLEELRTEVEAEKTACEELAAKKGEQLEEFMALYQMEDELLFNYMEEIDNNTATIAELYEQQMEAQKAESVAREAKEAEARRIAEEKAKKEAEERAAKAAAEAAARAAAEAAIKAQRLSAADGVIMTTETNLYKMIWPLPGDGRTFSGFGPRVAPCPGASTFHNGVDIGGEMGATVVAVLAGKVTRAGYSASAGNYVQIDHGDGVSTRYCHASKLLVSVGDYVLQGQPIMLVGSTGVSTGPHLHFAVLINGSYVDPMKYIKYTE